MHVQVPTGAAHASAADGQTYVLDWAQDDDGRLHLQAFQAVARGSENYCAPLV